jgi:hypothetical protein
MNNKSVWIFKCSSPEQNESVQRVAFSFGYGWVGVSPKENQSCMNVVAKYLFFRPGDKSISWENSILVEEGDENVVDTLEKALPLFKNPPKVEKQWKNVEGHTVFSDGSVLIKNRSWNISISPTELDVINKVREEFLGKTKVEKKQRYPLVNFFYWDGGHGEKLYEIAVLSKTGEHLEGFDVNDGFTYKMFPVNKTNNIVFVGFLEK